VFYLSAPPKKKYHGVMLRQTGNFFFPLNLYIKVYKEPCMRTFKNVIFDLCDPGKCFKAIQTVELQEKEY
jgi:hypothetical protein